MSLLTFVWADLRRHKLANALNLLLLMLGVAIIAGLLLIGSEIGSRFERDAQNIDMVIGAKGSPLQLILSTVYHLDIPTGNIPLDEANRWAKNPAVAKAIPISLGDNTRGYRIVGRVWQKPMEAVIGAEVANAGLKLDGDFVGAHGLGAGGHMHAENPYHVVGVLAPTGSVLDRLVLTSLESVWEIHAAHHHQAEAGHESAHEDHEAGHGDDDDHDHGHEDQAAAFTYQPSHEITALLIRFRSPLAMMSMPRMVNMQSNLQAAVPAFETARLLQLLGFGFDTMRALAGVLIAVAALSVFVALYNAMETRQYDLAVLRSLGLSRQRVVLLLWLQALLLSVAGTLLGLLLGHCVVELLGHLAGTAKGVNITGFTLLADELPLLLLPLVVGTLAAWLPAWRAYRTDLAAVLSRG